MKIDISIEEDTCLEALNEEYDNLRDKQLNLLEALFTLLDEFRNAALKRPLIPVLKTKILNLFRSNLNQIWYSEEEEQVYQENLDRIQTKIEENEQMASLINQRLDIVTELLNAHEQPAHS